jgi:hypothetical protein
MSYFDDQPPKLVENNFMDSIRTKYTVDNTPTFNYEFILRKLTKFFTDYFSYIILSTFLAVFLYYSYNKKKQKENENKLLFNGIHVPQHNIENVYIK